MSTYRYVFASIYGHCGYRGTYRAESEGGAGEEQGEEQGEAHAPRGGGHGDVELPGQHGPVIGQKGGGKEERD